MKRRSFIRISTIASATVLLPYSYTSCSDESSLISILATPNQLLEIMPKEIVHKIGKEYITKVPTEAKKDVLITYVSKGIDQTLTELNKMITDDFISENTIIIDGWIISRTEARQCALYTLLD